MAGPSELLRDSFAKESKPGLEAFSVDLYSKTLDSMKRARRIGDEHTWITELVTTGVAPSSTPDVVLESTTFTTKETTVAAPGTPYYLHCYTVEVPYILDHPVLHHSYTFPKSNMENFQDSINRIRCLNEQLSDSYVIELGNIAKNRHPPQYDQILNGTLKANESRGTFNLPDGWKFCDDEVDRYLDQV